MKKSILLYVILAISVHVSAQENLCSYNLRGIVIDSLENTTLANTLIETEDKKTTSTNKNGEFEISNICSGILKLHVSHLHCEHLHININVTKDTFITIYVQHTQQEIEGFKYTVNQSRSNTLNTSNQKTLELRLGNSISAMMQDLGSISLLKTGVNVGKPMVNGLHSNRVLIINNGIRQEGQNWGMEHAPEIDGFLANEIELIKGAETLRYGSDGIGGVLLIKPKSIFTEKANTWKGEINSTGSSNGRGAIFNASIGSMFQTNIPLYFRIQGTSKQFGNSKTSQDFLANTGFREQNYSLNMGIKKGGFQNEIFYSEFLNTIGVYLGSQIGNLNDLQKAMNSQRPLIQSDFSYAITRPYQKVQHRLLKIKSEWDINSKNTVEATLSYQKNHRSEFDVLRSTTAFQGPSFDYYINTSILEVLWSRSDFHIFNFKAGFFALHQSNAYTGRFYIPGFIQNSLATFFIAKKQIKKLKLEMSVRYDSKHYEIFLWNNNVSNIQDNQYSGFAYALYLSQEINKQNTIQFTHTSTWRPPAPNELHSDGLHQGLATFERGDSNLKIERSFNQSIHYLYQSKRFRTEIESYFQYIRGYINLIPSNETQLTIRGAYPVFAYTQSNAALYGVNVKTQYQINRQLLIGFQGKLPFGDDRKYLKPLPQMPAMRAKVFVEFDYKSLHTVFWNEYTAKQNRYTENSDFLAPPPAYHLFGFDLLWKFSIKKQAIRLGLSLENIGNTAYRDYLNRYRYFIDEQGFNATIKLQIPIQILNNKKQK